MCLLSRENWLCRPSRLYARAAWRWPCTWSGPVTRCRLAAKRPHRIWRSDRELRTARDVYGKTHHLTDYADQQLIVVIFVGNDCPLVKLYASRLAELAGEFGPRGVVFLGINSNRQDTLTEVAAFARQAKIEFALLKDPDNSVADRFLAHSPA